MKYLFRLLFSLLLMAAAAKADTAPPPNTLTWNIGADPSGPARIDVPHLAYQYPSQLTSALRCRFLVDWYAST